MMGPLSRWRGPIVQSPSKPSLSKPLQNLSDLARSKADFRAPFSRRRLMGGAEISPMSNPRMQWGEPPWPRGSEIPQLASPSLSASPDVAIVGGGLTGTSTALHLAKRGIRAIVYEAALIADGASGRTGGL